MPIDGAMVFRVTLKGNDGKLVYMRLLAKNAEEAEQLAQEYQYRRKARFPLTFERLAQAADSGKPGQLAIGPQHGGAALTEAWVKAETEKRKRDAGRYEKPFKVMKVEEAKT